MVWPGQGRVFGLGLVPTLCVYVGRSVGIHNDAAVVHPANRQWIDAAGCAGGDVMSPQENVAVLDAYHQHALEYSSRILTGLVLRHREVGSERPVLFADRNNAGIRPVGVRPSLIVDRWRRSADLDESSGCGHSYSDRLAGAGDSDRHLPCGEWAVLARLPDNLHRDGQSSTLALATECIRDHCGIGLHGGGVGLRSRCGSSLQIWTTRCCIGPTS